MAKRSLFKNKACLKGLEDDKLEGDVEETVPEDKPEKDTSEDQLSSIRDKLKKSKSSKLPPVPAKPAKKQEHDYSDDEDDEEAEMKRKREEIQREIKELTREMKRGKGKDEKPAEDEPKNKKMKEKELTEEEKAGFIFEQEAGLFTMCSYLATLVVCGIPIVYLC